MAQDIIEKHAVIADLNIPKEGGVFTIGGILYTDWYNGPELGVRPGTRQSYVVGEVPVYKGSRRVVPVEKGENVFDAASTMPYFRLLAAYTIRNAKALPVNTPTAG